MRVGIALSKQKDWQEKLPAKLRAWGLKGGATTVSSAEEVSASGIPCFNYV